MKKKEENNNNNVFKTGHANIQLIKGFKMTNARRHFRMVVVDPVDHPSYSGMVPGLFLSLPFFPPSFSFFLFFFSSSCLFLLSLSLLFHLTLSPIQRECGQDSMNQKKQEFN